MRISSIHVFQRRLLKRYLNCQVFLRSFLFFRFSYHCIFQINVHCFHLRCIFLLLCLPLSAYMLVSDPINAQYLWSLASHRTSLWNTAQPFVEPKLSFHTEHSNQRINNKGKMWRKAFVCKQIESDRLPWDRIRSSEIGIIWDTWIAGIDHQPDVSHSSY